MSILNNKLALTLLMVSAVMLLLLQSAASPVQSSTESINLVKRGCYGNVCGILTTGSCCLGYSCSSWFSGTCMSDA
ncbi:hypothetical protein F5H01DRAFT_355356 [Linnemannia elongata]|nr:hypothetical protein F5H01DRAFT_355356 [Linnemannia elongata]